MYDDQAMNKTGIIAIAILLLLGLVVLLAYQILEFGTASEPTLKPVDGNESETASESLIFEPIDQPSEPERIELEKRPVEKPEEDRSDNEVGDGAKTEDKIRLSGTISAVDEAGFRFDNESGSFSFKLLEKSSGIFSELSGYSVTYRHVKVVDGKWSTTVPSDVKIRFGDVKLRDRLTFFVEEKDAVMPEDVVIPADGVMHIEARWPPQTVLHVKAADTGMELSQVDLAMSTDSFFRADSHPGKNVRIVQSGADSPIELEMMGWSLFYARYGGSVNYVVRSPGYAWKGVKIDFRAGGKHVVLLDPCGVLEVFVSGYDVKSPCELRIRRLDSEWGEKSSPIVEIPIDRDGPIRIESLRVGRYLVTAESGDWFNKSVTLGRVEVDVGAGCKALATLVLEPVPDHAIVPLSGTVSMPSAWEIEGFSLSVRLLDTKLSSVPGHHHFFSRELERVDGLGETIYSWDAGEVQAGLYQFKVDPPYYLSGAEVGPDGSTDVRIAVPPPCLVAIRVVDKDTGQDVSVDKIVWHPKRPRGSSGCTLEHAERNETSGLFEFRAPQGEIEVGVSDREYWTEKRFSVSLHVGPGLNHHTIKAYRLCSFILIVKDGDRNLPRDMLWNIIPKPVDKNNSSQVHGTSYHPDGMRVIVGAPGLYRFSFPKIDGYKPVGDQEVLVRKGEPVRHVIELEPEH